MKIERIKLKKVLLSDFMEEHNLTLVSKESINKAGANKHRILFAVYLKDVLFKEEGAQKPYQHESYIHYSEEEAIESYIRVISKRIMRLDKDYSVVKVPFLIYEEDKES